MNSSQKHVGVCTTSCQIYFTFHSTENECLYALCVCIFSSADTHAVKTKKKYVSWNSVEVTNDKQQKLIKCQNEPQNAFGCLYSMTNEEAFVSSWLSWDNILFFLLGYRFILSLNASIHDFRIFS